MSLYSDLNYIKPFKNSILGDCLIYDVDDVFQSIFAILGTKKGERVFRPNFGLNLEDYLFEPCDSITAMNIFYDIKNVISLEPRVNFNMARSSVTPVPDSFLFIITLYFSILGFNDTERSLNLVLNQKERMS